MKDKLDFTRWEPPVVTEKMLMEEQARRQKFCFLVILYVAALATCLSAGWVAWYVSLFSGYVAMYILIGLVLVVTACSVAVAAILSKKGVLLFGHFESR